MKTIEETMSIIHLENNHRKINSLEEIEILKAASSKYLLNVQTSPLISDLNSKINSPDQATNKILNTKIYNNQWFKLQLSTAQARRQMKLQDLLKNVALATKDLQEKKTTCEWDGDGIK
jgi:hypothetical protein